MRLGVEADEVGDTELGDPRGEHIGDAQGEQRRVAAGTPACDQDAFGIDTAAVSEETRGRRRVLHVDLAPATA